MAKIIPLPSPCISLGQAYSIVKYLLNDSAYSVKERTMAIEKVAYMPTHNGITKAELITALRWLFETYEFDTK